MTDRLLRALSARFPLTPGDAGAFAAVKASGMTFRITRYDAAGLGSLSVMTASGFLGLMKMDTLILNATGRDVPLLSYDRIRAMGNDTLILELYDTLLAPCDLQALADLKAGAAALPDHDLGTHWYDGIKLPQSLSKRGKKGQSAAFDGLAERYAAAYADLAAAAPPCDPAAKKARAAVYVEGLLKNGGPSTDAFTKAIGPERTAELFRTVLFGTE